MTEGNEVQKYRKEKTLELVDKYKDLIEKTFEVLDKDLLQEKINHEDDKASEEKYLESIKKRRVSLDEVDLMLDKIEKLERALLDSDSAEINPTPQVSVNPTKRFAKKTDKK